MLTSVTGALEGPQDPLALPHPGNAFSAGRDDDGRKALGERRRRRGCRGEIGHGEAAKLLGLDRVDHEQVDQGGELSGKGR